MKNRILSIALALSLLAVVFAALPTSAQVTYTGSIKTTDDTGNLKDTYIQGQQVYVIVEVKNQGVWSDEPIRVRLVPTTGRWVSQFVTHSDDPADGWYNSTTAAGHLTLSTGAGITNDLTSYYVVLYRDGTMQEIARTTIVVKKTGLSLDPDNGIYYPGQAVVAKLVTTSTTVLFYVHTVNDTGVTMPNMNWTGQSATTGWWERAFTIASDLPDGTYTMRVRDSTTHAIMRSINFDVQKYVFYVEADRSYYLPGMTANIQYMTMDVATYTQATGVAITYCAMWYNSSGNATWLNSTLDGVSGVQQFVIPTDIAMWQDVDIIYWANESTRSASDSVTLRFAMLSANVAIAPAGTHMPGETVAATVTVYLGGGDPLPGATVDMSILANGTAIPAYGSASLTTDLQGQVTHTFTLVDAAADGAYIVSAKTTMVGFSATAIGLFQVQSTGEILVNLDKDRYYGGDEIVATLTPLWNGKVVDVSSFAYGFMIDTGVLVWGNTSETTVSATIPADYYGDIDIGVTAYYNGIMISGSDSSVVRFADITLTSQKSGYRPGDTLVFDWNILTGASTGILMYEISDSNGLLVMSDSPAFATTGSFSQLVPTVNAPGQYYVHMWMTTAAGGYADADLTVNMLNAHELQIWVEKSGYADGTYKPGQTVKLHYSIGTYATEPLKSYRLYVSTSYNPVGMQFIVTDSTGTVEFALPSDAPAAQIGIYATLIDPVTSGWVSDDSTAITVSGQLTGWDKSVAGMSAIDFSILLLLIIMILLLIVMPFL
ncbi:MAG: hypothetical protein KJ672_06180, partial [Candidatus Thermoplasmatota archaeon]|nr:hypothetical protein [Candidatus Thermoplasmatota archaeon]